MTNTIISTSIFSRFLFRNMNAATNNSDLTKMRFAVILFFIVLVRGVVAQWIQCNLPYSAGSPGPAFCPGSHSVIIKDHTLFAGTTMGLFTSKDSGSTWSRPLLSIPVGAFAVMSNGNIIGGCLSPRVMKIFILKHTGTDWVLADSASLGNYNGDIFEFAVIGNTILAATNDYKIFRSADNGISWDSITTNLKFYMSGGPGTIRNFATIENTVFAGSTAGIFKSTDTGTTWERISMDHVNDLTQISELFVNGATLYTSASTGAYCSYDTGKTWVSIKAGLPSNVNCFTVIGNVLFAGLESGGIYRSAIDNPSWTSSGLGLPEKINIVSLVTYGTMIFACGAEKAGIFCSSDSGNSWKWLFKDLTTTSVNTFAGSSNAVFAGTSSGVFRSTDDGTTWTTLNNGLTNLDIRALTANEEGDVFAGTRGGGVFQFITNEEKWAAVNNGLTDLNVNAFAVCGNSIFVGAHPCVYRSDDAGASWKTDSSGMTQSTLTNNSACLSLLAHGSDVMAGMANSFTFYPADSKCPGLSNESIYLLSGGRTSWVLASNGLPVSCGCTFGSNAHCQGISLGVTALAAKDSFYFALVNDSGIYRSPNPIASWRNIGTGIPTRTILALENDTKSLFAGTDGNGVFFSPDNGENWKPFSTGLRDLSIKCLLINNNTLFAGSGTLGGRVWRHSLQTIGIKNSGYAYRDRISPTLFIRNRNGRSIEIAFSLTKMEKVKLNVYTISGHLVTTLIDAYLCAGQQCKVWDMHDMASAYYLIEMKSGTNALVKKISCIR
jgi:photosystem II stability/assembly factor-like uncharacterized protein